MQISKFRIGPDETEVIEQLVRSSGKSATQICRGLIRTGIHARREQAASLSLVRAALEGLENGDVQWAEARLQDILELVTIESVPNSRGGCNGSAIHRDRTARPGS